ncbi:phage tail protein [Consotaella salsifontis]|uniref:Putative phage tail protein n=1 Tax=Consotaella salsifontis TaxID=1365950 RepID=A0A1T4SSX4_9HYPH|nr:phage tail protein [Consotaella salsifontis]SKA30978.1 Putative phage tail protein [Consotaella salsifontis]
MAIIAAAVAAIATAAGASASFAAFIGQAAVAAVGIGLSLAGSAFAKKPKAQGTGGTKLEVQYGGTVGRQIAVGLVATAGQDIYSNTYDGKSNKRLQKVYVLSDSRITSVKRVAINGYWYVLSTTDITAEGAAVIATGSEDAAVGHLRIKVYDGTQTAADPNLVAKSNPAGRWTAAHVGYGVAYAVVTAKWDDDDMSAVPQLLFEIEGAPLYDPRKDSSVGGSGAHRWNDPSTWEYTENPIIQVYAYERGFWIGDQLIIGKGMPASDLPVAAWMAAANVCDETVDGSQRYRSGYIYEAGDGITHQDNLEPVLNAAAAMLIERVDGDYPMVGANQPVVATLTDADLIVDAPRKFQAKRSRTSLINAVWGSYNNPSDLWSQASFEPQVSDTALAADREWHGISIDWKAVDNEGQAIRLGDIALRENRYQASATITVRPRWVVLEVGDWISWASARYGTRTYRVVGRSLAPLNAQGARNVTLTLQEIGNGVYDSSVVIPERTPRVGQEPPQYVSTLPGFGALPTTVTSEDGRTYPALYAYWTLIDDVTVDSVVIRYWAAADDSQMITKVIQIDQSAPQTDAILAEGVLPRTDYEIEGTVAASPPRGVTWAGPVTVTTGDEELSVRLIDLKEDVQEVLTYGQQNFYALQSLIEGLASSVALTNATVVAEALAQNDRGWQLSAQIIEERTTRASEDEALATRTDAVQATVTDLSGQVQGQATALNSLSSSVSTLNGTVSAQASALTGVQAAVGDATADGLIRFEAVAAPAGVSARLSIQVRASTASGYANSGIYLDAMGDGGSRIVNMANQFIVTDGANAYLPLVYEGGVLKLNVAQFYTLQSGNGKLVIDGTNGTISIYD